MKKYLAILTILLFSAVAGHGDHLSEKMNEFGLIEADPPKPGGKGWREMNHSDAFIVEFDKRLIILPPEKNKFRSYGGYGSFFDAGTVKYVGVDRGEFGGGLYLDNYEEGKEPFFRGNIDALIPIGDDLYIIEGLAHMGFNGGSIHAIRNYKKPSPPERITLLPSAPEAVTLDEKYGKKRIVIAGHDSFMVLELDSRLNVIHNNTFWGSLYPSSIVKYHEYFIFGIRGGVVATTADTLSPNRIRFFKPEKPLNTEGAEGADWIDFLGNLKESKYHNQSIEEQPIQPPLD